MTAPEPGRLLALLAFLAEVPDPHDRDGRCHPRVAMLAHACCAIARWGRDRPIEQMHRLGYCRPLPWVFLDIRTSQGDPACVAIPRSQLGRLLNSACYAH